MSTQPKRRRGPKPLTQILSHGRVCVVCEEFKTWDSFYAQARGARGYSARCRPCENISNASYNKTKTLEGHHNITTKDVATLFDAQGGVCPICLSPMNKPMVDHCHTTGAIRGLLCFSCNVGLGHFQDDPGALVRAAAYLNPARFPQIESRIENRISD